MASPSTGPISPTYFRQASAAGRVHRQGMLPTSATAIPFFPNQTFGQIVFDPIPGVPPTPPAGQDPKYPLWDPAPPNPTLQSECAADTAAPPIVYSDEPETWNGNTWVGHVAVKLEEETVSGNGLIFWYYLNNFATTTHLYIGTASSAGTFQFIAGALEATNSANGATFATTGAQASRIFLKQYTTNTGFAIRAAGVGPTPAPFISRTIGPNQIAIGEAFVTGLRANTLLYVYADNCATGCPDVSFAPPSQKDSHGMFLYRRGLFPKAGFSIPHDYTEALTDANQPQNPIFSFNDLYRPANPPPPVPLISCAAPLAGTSTIDRKAVVLNGNYGVPVTIAGTPSFMRTGQIWYIGARGGGPFEVAAALAGFIDPKTKALIPNDTYLLPCSNCLAPTPTATITDPTGTGTAAAVMGLNTNGDPRKIVYIQSGFDPAPVRLYYLDP